MHCTDLDLAHNGLYCLPKMVFHYYYHRTELGLVQSGLESFYKKNTTLKKTLNVSVNSKPDHPPPPPGKNPQATFLMANSPSPRQKEFKTPTPWSNENELKPQPLGYFSQLFTIKTRKNDTEIM